jgi:hypothetical protein
MQQVAAGNSNMLAASDATLATNPAMPVMCHGALLHDAAWSHAWPFHNTGLSSQSMQCIISLPIQFVTGIAAHVGCPELVTCPKGLTHAFPASKQV